MAKDCKENRDVASSVRDRLQFYMLESRINKIMVANPWKTLLLYVDEKKPTFTYTKLTPFSLGIKKYCLD